MLLPLLKKTCYGHDTLALATHITGLKNMKRRLRRTNLESCAPLLYEKQTCKEKKRGLLASPSQPQRPPPRTSSGPLLVAVVLDDLPVSVVLVWRHVDVPVQEMEEVGLECVHLAGAHPGHLGCDIWIGFCAYFTEQMFKLFRQFWVCKQVRLNRTPLSDVEDV